LSDEQIDYYYRHGICRNPMLVEVLKKFGAIAFKRCSVMMEFEQFLRRIRGNQRDGVCLEIGTYNGISAIVLSQYFARVICVSVDNDPGVLLKHDICAHLGIRNIRFFDCKDNVEKKALVDSLAFDFCYQDGDHVNDTKDDFALVERCGRVLFHEYWPIQPVVWNLVNALPDHEVARAQNDCMAYWQRGGL
jgi:predicted O-methyltransferase YrrM